MRKRRYIRFFGLLTAVLFCAALLPLSALASAATYDPLYPENLSEGHLTAGSAILIEEESGDVIFEKNADVVMYPASTTKIMTVWLALEMLRDQSDKSAGTGIYQKVTVSENAVNIAADESSAKLAAGEEVRLIDLMYAAMLLSGNDAATAIAEGLCGSVEGFAALMNQTAAALGCANTHFVNANGLHDENHYTTARDMAIIARAAMQNETFRDIAACTSYAMPKDNIYRSRKIENRNKFLNKAETRAYYADGTGIKTGTTSAAGNCFVGSAKRDGVSLISVALGATDDIARYTDTQRLMNYGFSQYVSTSIAEIYAQNPRTVDIRSFALDDPEVGRLTLNLRKVDAKASDAIVTTKSQVDYWVQNLYSVTVTEFTRELKAPIEKDEVMGTLTYYPPNGTPVVYELIAGRSIAVRPQLVPTVDEIYEAAMNDSNPFPRITFEIVFLYLILPACAVVLLVKGVRFLHGKLHHKRKMKTFKPTTRYFR